MSKVNEHIKRSFVSGVTEAVSGFEKNASYNSWMKNDRFRENFSKRIVDLVKRVNNG